MRYYTERIDRGRLGISLGKVLGKVFGASAPAAPAVAVQDRPGPAGVSPWVMVAGGVALLGALALVALGRR